MRLNLLNSTARVRKRMRKGLTRENTGARRLERGSASKLVCGAYRREKGIVKTGGAVASKEALTGRRTHQRFLRS